MAAGAAKGFSLSSHLRDPGWSSALQPEMQKDYFKSLEALLAKDYSPDASSQTFPPQELIFNAFNLTPLKQVIVCMNIYIYMMYYIYNFYIMERGRG